MIHSSTDTVYVSLCHGNKTPEVTTEKEERFLILPEVSAHTPPLAPFLVGLVRQGIMMGAAGRESLHPMARVNERQRRSWESPNPLQGHAPNDLIHFHSTPSLQGSSVTQQCHRLGTMTSTNGSLEEYLRFNLLYSVRHFPGEQLLLPHIPERNLEIYTVLCFCGHSGEVNSNRSVEATWSHCGVCVFRHCVVPCTSLPPGSCTTPSACNPPLHASSWSVVNSLCLSSPTHYWFGMPTLPFVSKSRFLSSLSYIEHIVLTDTPWS